MAVNINRNGAFTSMQLRESRLFGVQQNAIACIYLSAR
jgi:hypothetical protein